ncbi:MAG: type 4a pilus biogenesis protein PilO [Minisyncoccia bacterium]
MNSLVKQFYFELIISFIIISALIFGFLFFGKQISNYSAKIRNDNIIINQQSASIQHLGDLVTQYEQAKQYLNVLQNYIPTKDGLLNFATDLQAVASRHHLGYGFSYNGEGATDKSGINVMNFTANVSGALTDIIAFINDLNQFNYLVIVNHVTINKTQSGAYEAPIIGQVYYRVQ